MPKPLPRPAPPPWASDPKPGTRCRLDVYKHNNLIATHRLAGSGVATPKPCVLIGRGPTADVPLEHGSISRQHAWLGFDIFGKVILHDLGASNGTVVGGKRLGSCDSTYVADQTMLVFGESTRRYMLRIGVDASTAAMHKGILLDSERHEEDAAVVQEKRKAESALSQEQQPGAAQLAGSAKSMQLLTRGGHVVTASFKRRVRPDSSGHADASTLLAPDDADSSSDKPPLPPPPPGFQEPVVAVKKASSSSVQLSASKADSKLKTNSTAKPARGRRSRRAAK